MVPRLSFDVVTTDVEKNYDKMKIGWFLHTPFPTSEIYRTLPMREELLYFGVEGGFGWVSHIRLRETFRVVVFENSGV